MISVIYSTKKQKLIELIDHIGLWHRTTFPKEKLTFLMMGQKVLEEAFELLSAICRDFDKKKIEEEAADVFISLISTCLRYDLDLISAVERKLKILQTRNYKFIDGRWVR